MRATGNRTAYIILILSVFVLMSCATISKEIKSVTGVRVTADDAAAVVRTARAFRNSFADITEEEEYYIGRAVSALILAKYPVYENDALTAYVNRVGNAVSAFSQRPEIYAGYHFLILDSEEVNALAAPGGFIFITRGLIKRCQNEEMLGSILAHEVGHVVAKHGLQSIKKSRLVDAFRIMGQEASRKYSPQEIAALTSLFENALGDIVEKLIERGYDRKYEYEADELSIKIAAATGYNANGLLDFLQTMVDNAGESQGKGWFKTHPSAKDRLGRAEREIKKVEPLPAPPAVRANRFSQAVKSLK